jgi:hypothetical protein
MPAARTFRFSDRQRFDVAPGNAIDAFYHPFAYAARSPERLEVAA